MPSLFHTQNKLTKFIDYDVIVLKFECFGGNQSTLKGCVSVVCVIH